MLEREKRKKKPKTGTQGENLYVFFLNQAGGLAGGGVVNNRGSNRGRKKEKRKKEKHDRDG